MDEFAEVYERRIRPILEDRGLVSASESGRATPDSVFTRLFEAASPGALKEIGEALW
jgi:hypothetical protein